MNILKAPANQGQAAPSAHHIARICCTPTASRLKREASTTTDWQRADTVVLETFRTVVDAGNEKFGDGSHWIERRYTADPPAH